MTKISSLLDQVRVNLLPRGRAQELAGDLEAAIVEEKAASFEQGRQRARQEILETEVTLTASEYVPGNVVKPGDVVLILVDNVDHASVLMEQLPQHVPDVKWVVVQGTQALIISRDEIRDAFGG